MDTLRIYIVAGIRNMETAAHQGGLFANVGETERSASERVQDSDYKRKRGGGEWNILLEQYSYGTRDHAIHALLKKLPDTVVKWTKDEEFFFPGDPGDGSKAIPIIRGIIQQLSNKPSWDALPQFEDRDYQTDDIHQVVSKLKTLQRVLLSAFPGWGKSTCAPQIMHLMRDQTRGNLFLVSTPITDSLDGIHEALVTCGYGNSNFFPILTSDVNENTHNLILRKLAEGIDVVLLLSVQGLRRGDDGSRKFTEDDIIQINADLRERFNFLYTIPIRLWIRDEFHKEYGGHVTKKVFEGIRPEYLLDMTATPYNLIELGEYIKDQIVGDTILNVLKKKRGGDAWYQPFSNIHIETWEGAPLDGSELGELYESAEEWDPRKLVVMENNQLVHVDIIRALNRRMYGWHRLPSGKYIEGASKSKNPFSITSDPQLSEVAKACGFHVLAAGNNEHDANVRCGLYVETLNSDQLQKMWYVTADYVKTEAKRQQVKVVDVIKEQQVVAKDNGRLGLVVVTHKMLLTGSDIDFLGHIVLFDRRNTLNDFVQLIGRMFRLSPNKKDVKLYVACPGMNVSVKVYEAAKAEASQYGDGDPQEYYDLISITEYTESGGQFISQTVNYETMVERFNEYQDRVLVGDWYPKGHFNNYPELDALVDGLDFDQLNGSVRPTHNITTPTGAKVTKPKPKNVKEKEADNKQKKLGRNWKETVSTMLNESIRLGYSCDCVTLEDVFLTESAIALFDEDNVHLMFTLFSNVEFYQAVNHKYQARMEQVRSMPKDGKFFDLIFKNQEFKVKKSLVYVGLDLAEDWVNEI